MKITPRLSLPNRQIVNKSNDTALSSKTASTSAFQRRLKATPLALVLLGGLGGCGVLPTRSEIGTIERIIPVDKMLLTPFDLLFKGEIFAALVSIPMGPFVDVGELISGKSIFAPPFSSGDWRSPYSGPRGGTLYDASLESKAEKK